MDYIDYMIRIYDISFTFHRLLSIVLTTIVIMHDLCVFSLFSPFLEYLFPIGFNFYMDLFGYSTLLTRQESVCGMWIFYMDLCDGSSQLAKQDNDYGLSDQAYLSDFNGCAHNI